MSRFTLGNAAFSRPFLALMLLLALQAAIPRAFAQNSEKTFGDSYVPLVYPVRDTGAFYGTRDFPSLAQLPIVRPLPDPFRFADGWRDTSFASWERHRNDYMVAIEKYEIGPVPDCSDCTITANYAPATAGGSGTLTVNVTRNGKTITLTSGVYIPQGMGKRSLSGVDPHGDCLVRLRRHHHSVSAAHPARLRQSAAQRLSGPSGRNGRLCQHAGSRILLLRDV